MDTSDPEIVFDASGRCNHCLRAEMLLATRLPAYKTGEYRGERIADRIRRSGKGRDYDCIVGVSGGVDSTYAAYTAKKLGLRPLAVHFDNGWNSELAVSNIEQTLRRMGIELYTYVVDWEEFRDLQLSFLRASVPDAEIPTDHAIWALLYQAARRFGLRFIISGTNLSTESILPRSWTYYVTDWRYIKSIHEAFGTRPLQSYPHSDLPTFMRYVLVHRLRGISLLNAVEYNKAAAIAELQREIGWRDYGGKHRESIYTRFFQSYILPNKFGIDKRRAHLSSLIMTGQTSREAALEELRHPPADAQEMAADLTYVVKKLDLSMAEFEALMCIPPRSYRDFGNNADRFEQIKRVMRQLQQRRLLPQQVGL
jgi:N-acetyl sugar amidotransferase